MHYVIGDIHGHYTCFMKLIEKLNLTPEDRVILVGDICDRAPNEFEQRAIIDWCIENITNDGQFQMVLGNHEYDVLDYLEQVYRNVMDANGDCNTKLMYQALRGWDTMYRFFDRCKKTNVDLMKLLMFLRKLELFKEVDFNNHKYFITHSWLCPDSSYKLSDDEADFEDPVIRYMRGEVTKDFFNVYNSIWDRRESIYSQPMKYTVIHGHTPTMIDQYYKVDEWGTVVVKRGNINVDCGLFTGLEENGNLAAYCIETGESIYLYDKEFMTKCIDEFVFGNYKLASLLHFVLFGEYISNEGYNEMTDFDAKFAFDRKRNPNAVSECLDAMALAKVMWQDVEMELRKEFLTEIKEI